MFNELGPPTFPVAIPHPPPSALKDIAYLSGCVLPVSGASQSKTVVVAPSTTVKFLGAPIVATTAVGVTDKDALVNIVP